MMKPTDVIFLLPTMAFFTRGEITLHSITPDHYNYLEPPMKDEKPVNITINLMILSIRSVDENDLSFSLAVELWQYWNDWRLIFPNGTKQNYTILDSGWKDKLWNPHLYFVNAVDGKLDNIITPSSFFWLDARHNIYYCCRISVKLICDMDFTNFPHDRQVCSVKMSSAKFTEDKVFFKWSPLGKRSVKKDFTGLPQYHFGETEQLRCVVSVGRLNSSCVEMRMSLVRRTGYYIINVYIPTVLIVLMSMLTFWIPPDAIPARITLGVTSLLTIITKQYDTSLPNVSYIVALNIWLSCCIGFVFLSLVEYATLIALTARMKQNTVHGKREHCILPMIQLKVDGTWDVKRAWKSKVKRFEPKRLDFICRLIFPLFFGVFCLVYWLKYDK